MMGSLQFTPLLPPLWIALILTLIAIFVLIGLWARKRASVLRLLALFAFALALLNPGLIKQTREPLPGTVAIVLDQSQSQSLGERKQDSQAVASALQKTINAQNGLQARLITVEPEQGKNPETRAFSALQNGLADLPPARLSGVVIITDGQVHDIARQSADLGFNAPVNALISGYPDEFDRKVIFVAPPRFGIVKKPLGLNIMIEDQGPVPNGASVPAELRINGELEKTLNLVPGKAELVEITLPHAGDNIIELTTPAVPGELTTKNNTAVTTINGIRQNLRVLLVSGEPHNGERVWRDLLKSDTGVDLIHFTILRLPDRSDNTPENELSLIAFPTRELFIDKINDFDLIIFDRYQHYDVMARIYYNFMAQYVERGGALLMATGPEFAGKSSLALTALQKVIPASPTGTVIEKPFRPTLTKEGLRHPVTNGLLEGLSGAPETWGRWLRQIDIEKPQNGTVLMSGADNKPLLLLAHAGQGRVGLLLSDEGWLWARGFEGGGPYAALYRRIAHWLMKEPELEEEALSATANGNVLLIRRQTMQDDPGPAKVTAPSGKEVELSLEKKREGLFTANFMSDETGLFTVEQGEQEALAYMGPVYAREYDDMISTPDKLQEIATSTGGNIMRLHQSGQSALSIPPLLVAERSLRQDGLIVRPPTESRLIASNLTPLFSGFVALAALLLLLAGTWWREGK